MKHICYNELIELEKGTYNKPIKLLVVGTFNPINDTNSAKWFYGREINEFWSLFPKMLGFESIHAADVDVKMENHHIICKQFCETNNFIIVDLIKELDAKLKGYTDSEIDKLNMNQITPFDFESAFKVVKPELVMFSFKGSSGKIIGKLKKQFIQFLNKNAIKYFEVPSASPIYRRGRREKLIEWKALYSKMF